MQVGDILVEGGTGQAIVSLGIAGLLFITVFLASKNSVTLKTLFGRYSRHYSLLLSLVVSLGTIITVQELSMAKTVVEGVNYYVVPFSTTWASILGIVAMPIAITGIVLMIVLGVRMVFYIFRVMNIKSLRETAMMIVAFTFFIVLLAVPTLGLAFASITLNHTVTIESMLVVAETTKPSPSEIYLIVGIAVVAKLLMFGTIGAYMAKMIIDTFGAKPVQHRN